MGDKYPKNNVWLTPLEDKNPRKDIGTTPLHNAAYQGHLQICQNTIKNMEDKNTNDNNGTTPLHNAAYQIHLKLQAYKYLVFTGPYILALFGTKRSRIK